jgi:hypothetical protein
MNIEDAESNTVQRPLSCPVSMRTAHSSMFRTVGYASESGETKLSLEHEEVATLCAKGKTANLLERCTFPGVSR